MKAASKEFHDLFERAVKQKLTTMRRYDPAVLKLCMSRLEEQANAGAALVELPLIVENAVKEFDGVPV